MTDVVIAAYRRSPFHLAHKGALTKLRPDEMAAQVVRALVAETGIDPATIEDLVLGCAFPEGEQGLNAAKLIAFIAGLPESVAGTTVNRFCGSSMQAVHQAAGAIKMGAGEAFICAGVESMTRVPMMGFNPMPHPGLAEGFPAGLRLDGRDGGECRRAATRSPAPSRRPSPCAASEKAAAAQREGRLEAEIVAIEAGGERVAQDGCIRAETTAETLAGLKPAFRQDGTVTAGTSSPLTDGAVALLVCSAEYAQGAWADAAGKVRSVAVAGCAPEVMGMGPVGATRKALARAGITAKRARRGRAERGLRLPGAGLHARARHRRGQGEPRWRRHRAGPSAGRDRRAHHRQGGAAAAARRAAAMRWRRSASAAARASPRCWRRCDVLTRPPWWRRSAGARNDADPQGRGDRRRRDGRRHRGAGGQCRRAGGAAGHRPGRRARRRRSSGC